MAGFPVASGAPCSGKHQLSDFESGLASLERLFEFESKKCQIKLD